MDTVLAALLGGLALVLVACIPFLASIAKNAKNAARSTAATHYEVKNDHTKNLRLDVDDKHDELLAALERRHNDTRQIVEDRHDETMQLLRAQGRRLGRVETAARELREWLGDVDKRTQPRRITK